MILCVVSIRDSATEAYARPAFVHKAAEAVRSFSDEVNRPSTIEQPNQLYLHPADYELFQLGFYDDNTGQFSNHLERLVRAQDVRTDLS